jgi:hypothetical protein
MSLTKVSYSMIAGSPINVLDFGATGNGYTDDSAAIQKAVNAAIATTGSVYFPAGKYLVGTSVEIASPTNYVGGVKLYGNIPQSLGTVVTFLQKDLNIPVFTNYGISTQFSGLSFTVWAGSTYTSAGVPIVATAYTSNSITFNANPFLGGSAVIWNATVTATDGTVYTNVIQFSCQGSWYADSMTVNGNGTVTFNNVKGANGTLNAYISGVIGYGITFVSLVAQATITYTNSNAGMIYNAVKENQFYDHLWFYGCGRCINFSALGSGGGPGVGVGNAGFFSDIIVDGSVNFIYAQGQIYGAQITNSQFYGCATAFYAPYGNIQSSNFTNLQVITGKMFQANSDLYGLTVTGCSFNTMDGYGYSNFLFNCGGVIERCTFTGNNFGRSTDTVINCDSVKSSVISGNDIVSNGEGGSTSWLYVNGANGVTYSYLGGNNFAGLYTSSPYRIGFLNASPSIVGSTFGGEFIGYQAGVKVIGWLSPTFQNSWANVGGGSQNVAYFQDQNGVVSIVGELASGSSGTVAFTLPAGYRPLGLIRTYGRANTASGQVPMAVDIAANGTVTIQTAVQNWGDFGVISFPTRL